MSLVPMLLTNFTAGELAPRLYGRVDVSKYYNGCSRLENFLAHPHGGVSRRSGMRYVADCASHDRPSRLFGFEDATGLPYVAEFAEKTPGQGVVRLYAQGGRVLDGQGVALELSSPYLAAQFGELRAVQDGQRLVLTHPAVQPYALERSSLGAWTLSAMSILAQPSVWGTGNWPTCACVHEDRLVFAATAQQPYTIWCSRTGDHADFRLLTREVPASGWDDFQLVDGSGDGLASGKSGDTFLLLAGDVFRHGRVLRGVNAAGETRYYRYKGVREIVIGASSARATVKDAPSASTEIESVLSGAGVLQTAFWEEFSVGARIDADPGSDPLDDDAVELTLSATHGGRIAFLAAKSGLQVGATSGVWTVSGSSLNQPLTPSGVKAVREGTVGASLMESCPAGRATLFVQRSGRRVRELAYSLDADGLAARDLTLLSSHIAGPGITQLCFVQQPDPVLFCVREDGVLLAMTYLPEQDVCAFARITTDGAVEAVASAPGDMTGHDELWLTVRRQTPDPQNPGTMLTRRFLEVLEPVFADLDEAEDAREAFFVDSGMTYRGAPATRVTGLSHLAGREVQILADGAVMPARTVAPDGSLSLDRPASIVHAGLGYASTLSPLRLEYAGQRGTAQGKTKRLTEVTLRLFRTLGGGVGTEGARQEPLLSRTSADPMGGAPALFTGDKTVRLPSGWGTDGVLRVTQEQPLPMTVLLIAPTMALNE